ncbi:arginase, hepatic isoform X2 [Lingula anatina]|uniref:Arginase n=1 Tax=Lingula anatina TaxID=7574 RepID=A0A1S3KFF9_LINAN|nr:arginase, hepatic isoform X2 [Lingula anatina]|eukprot:XP_013421375.1 arginase, hepatic isoform X2 [Lingula anatina]
MFISSLFSGITKYFVSQTRSLVRLSKDKVGVIGVPSCKGQSAGGVQHGPKALRQAGIIDKLTQLGVEVYDYGDLVFEQFDDDTPILGLKNPKNIGLAAKKISDQVSRVIKDDQIALTLGGDHSLSIGTIHGHAAAEKNMCLVWVDAHADINTPLTSPSGNVHGMALSFLVKELKEYIPQIPHFEWIKPCISAKDIAYIGLRDLDPGELWIVRNMGISCFTMHEVDRYGIDMVLRMSMQAINPHGDRPIHLSFDVDSLDPRISAATGTPVPGGLSVREGIYIAEELAATGKLTAVDLVEVNPLLGTKEERDLTVYAVYMFIISGLSLCVI